LYVDIYLIIWGYTKLTICYFLIKASIYYILLYIDTTALLIFELTHFLCTFTYVSVKLFFLLLNVRHNFCSCDAIILFVSYFDFVYFVSLVVSSHILCHICFVLFISCR